MLYLAIFWALCVIWLVIALLRAPEGYEDEDGWHPVKP